MGRYGGVIGDEGDMGLESGASTARSVPSGGSYNSRSRKLHSQAMTWIRTVGSADKSTLRHTDGLNRAPGKFGPPGPSRRHRAAHYLDPRMMGCPG